MAVELQREEGVNEIAAETFVDALKTAVKCPACPFYLDTSCEGMPVDLRIANLNSQLSDTDINFIKNDAPCL